MLIFLNDTFTQVQGALQERIAALEEENKQLNAKVEALLNYTIPKGGFTGQLHHDSLPLTNVQF